MMIGGFASVNAVTLFQDNFDEYNYTNGLNLYHEMNLHGWYVYDYTHPINDDDITIETKDPIDDEYVSIMDDSYIRASINTSGYENIALSYYRRTSSLPSNDQLEIEWRIGDSGDWTTLEIVLGTHYTWILKNWNLSGADNQQEIQIRFRLNNGDGDYGHVDSVLVTGKLIEFQDRTAPDTNVTYFTRYNETYDPRQCDNTHKAYVNYQEVIGNGISSDAGLGDSPLINVQYKWDNFAIRNAVCEDGFCNDGDITELWHSDPGQDGWILDGLHVFCGRAKDKANNLETIIYPDDCCDLCVDIIDPTADKPEAQSIGNCYEGFTNKSEVTFIWDYDTTGCADIAFFDVFVEIDDGGFNVIASPTTNSYTLAVSDGHSYRIKVRPTDMAGNEGAESDASNYLYVDQTNPIVDITAPTEVWHNSDFIVSETDDDLNLLECQIMIQNNGDTPYTSEWSASICNADFNVILDTYCPDDGSCVVTKRAKDKACNVGTDQFQYMIDRTAPETTKTVGDPKSKYALGDWYVTDHTTYTLTCDDGSGSGCYETYYNANGTWMKYTGLFTLSLPEGQFTLQWYSTDNVGNVENIKSEIDFMDNTDPTTTKTVGDPKSKYALGDWYVTNHTTYTLTCSDGGSGCDEIYYRVNGGGWILYDGSFVIDYLKDGQFTLEWYGIDNVENAEDIHSEIDFMDNTAPTIIIVEPKFGEDEFGCGANIFTVKASITDDGSGVNGATAELFYANGTSTGRTVTLTVQQGYWKGNINHWNLLAGQYYVKVTAWDNLANTGFKTKDIELDYDVYFIGGGTFTVPKGQSGSTTFNVRLCHGGNATGMIMSKVCGGVDLNPVLSYSTWAFDINQESYMDFFNHIFNWQSNVFLPLNNSQDVIGVERIVTLTVSVPSDLLCSQSIDCKYMGYKFGAAYEGDNEPADPSEDLFGIGWFGVQCNDNSVTFIGSGVIPPVCINGEEKCEGTTYFSCESNQWSNKGQISGKCGYTNPSNGGGGGGGGGGSSRSASSTCTENWVCGTFGTCVNGIQFMSCDDENHCGTTNNQPALSRACTTETSSQDIQTNGNTGSTTDLITGNVVGNSNKAWYGSLLAVCIIALAIVVAVVARRMASKKA